MFPTYYYLKTLRIPQTMGCEANPNEGGLALSPDAKVRGLHFMIPSRGQTCFVKKRL